MANLDTLTLKDSSGIEKKLSRKTKQRVLKVVELIRQGCSKTKILELLQTEEGIKEHQAQRLYRAGMDYLTPSDDEQDDLRASVISTLQDLIEESRKDKDRANAIKALQQLSKIGGLETQKIDINSDIKINFNIDTEGDSEDEQGD